MAGLLRVGSAFALAGAISPEWDDFKAQYGKVYNGPEEEAKRHAIFDATLAFIAAENAKGQSFTVGIGPFADITGEEFSASYLGYTQPESDVPVLSVHRWEGEALADSLDWTEQGVVTPIKDQGQCGSCWAFSTTGALESGYALSGGSLVSLSEQQYVDCDKFPNLGCNGGNMNTAITWAETNDLCTEESYPYEAAGGSCRSSGCTVGLPSGSVTGVVSLQGLIRPASDADVMSALQSQPISIAIQADQAIFQHYTSGVMTGSCGSQVDHGVLLVGYGTDGSDDYWKVKNSWGVSWGDAGFVRFVRDKDQCGMNSQPVYPTFGSTVTV